MAIQNVDPRRCMGCKTCVLTCPVDVFRYDEKTKQAVAKYPEGVPDLPDVRQPLPRRCDHRHL